MKKTFVTVTLFVAMALAANATNRQQGQAGVKQTAADQTVNVATSSDSEAADATEQEDIYRTYALQNEENDKHIILQPETTTSPAVRVFAADTRHNNGHVC